MPRVLPFSAGHWMKLVETLLPTISNTEDWMSSSVMRLMCPFCTVESQICKGLLPIEYKMDRKPAWYVLWNIFWSRGGGGGEREAGGGERTCGVLAREGQAWCGWVVGAGIA